MSQPPRAAHQTRPPGPQRLPWIGPVLSYLRDPVGFVERTTRACPDIAAVTMFGLDIDLLGDPEAIRHVLVSNRRNYIKDRYLRAAKVVFGEGLLISEDPLWRRQRKLQRTASSSAACRCSRTSPPRCAGSWRPTVG